MSPPPVYDKHGRRIKHGDLLKTYHFTAALRRQRQYLYHVVRHNHAHDRLQGIPFHELANYGDPLADCSGRFVLIQSHLDCSDVEVIACTGAEFLPERPKSRPCTA